MLLVDVFIAVLQDDLWEYVLMNCSEVTKHMMYYIQQANVWRVENCPYNLIIKDNFYCRTQLHDYTKDYKIFPSASPEFIFCFC